MNFVSSADTRSTLNILWSCLFTILACTWTVQHLNVPEQREGCDPGPLGDMKWSLKRLWTSTKWMLCTILAPEVLITICLASFDRTRTTLPQLQEFAAQDGVPWTITHSQFADMGGFVVKSHVPEQLDKTQKNGTGPILQHPNLFHLLASNVLALQKLDSSRDCHIYYRG